MLRGIIFWIAQINKQTIASEILNTTLNKNMKVMILKYFFEFELQDSYIENAKCDKDYVLGRRQDKTRWRKRRGGGGREGGCKGRQMGTDSSLLIHFFFM